MEDVFAKYQAALRAGHQLAADGKFKDALAQYETAAQVAGERALPQIGIGSMNMRLSRPKDALAAYERALAAEPDNIDAVSGRAAALLALGRRQDASVATARLSELRGSPAKPAGVPAGLHTPMSPAETMAMAGEQARDAGQRDAAIDAWLAEAREHVEDQHFDAALDAEMRALALDTNSVRVHLELTRLYVDRGWRAEAAQRARLMRRLLTLITDDDTRDALDLIQGRIGAPA
jgi:tetratricopeptide (TPR) repeat protein